MVENEGVVGILTRDGLMRALAKHGQEYAVRDAMEVTFLEADPAEMLQSAMTRLQTCSCHTMPVAREGRLEGLLTMENVGEFVRIHAALKKAARAA